MCMTWIDKSYYEKDPVADLYTGNGYIKRGSQGNHVSPTTYGANYGNGFPHKLQKMPNGAWAPQIKLNSTYVVAKVEARNFPGARNQAWGRLVTAVRTGPASLGVALAESHEGLAMVAQRAGNCYRAYRDLRKGNFRSFLKELAIGPKRRHRNKIRSSINEASSLWLEYSFGWKPLFQDIYDGVRAVGQPVPSGKVSGSGSQSLDRRYVPSPTAIGDEVHTVVHCKQGATVHISNPNLYLLQQTGFANPALIAWELVPFSFVVDWVSDVGTSLGSITDLLGCSISGAYCTYFVRRASTTYTVYYSASKRFRASGFVTSISRKAGLDYPLPNFEFRHNIGSSLNRAANAVSLLGQILTK